MDIFCSKAVCHWRFPAHRWLWLEIYCSLMPMVGDFSAQWSFVDGNFQRLFLVGDFLPNGCLSLEISCSYMVVVGDFLLKVVCRWRCSSQRSFVVRNFLLKGRLRLWIFCSKVVCGWRFSSQRLFVVGDFSAQRSFVVVDFLLNDRL